MENSLYVGLSRQMVLRQEMDIIANNIANSDTTGFKVESLMASTDARAPAFGMGSAGAIRFVTADGVARDFGQGGLNRTDAPLDVAIQGQGFFRIRTAQGDRFTRDGRFRADDAGRLVTEQGDGVLDEGGGEIVIDPLKGPVTIAEDGTMSQGTERIGKLGVATFDDLSGLEKTGSNLYRNTSNLQPRPAAGARVRQGMLEGSNVQPVLEITRMIEVSRAYERIAKMMDSQGDLSQTAMQRLGRVQ